MSSEERIERMSLLRVTLDGLVPLYMLTLQRRGSIGRSAQECADIIAAHGDDLEHGRDGGADTLNAVAKAIATLALIRPEGIDLFGGHWCRNHNECGAA